MYPSPRTTEEVNMNNKPFYCPQITIEVKDVPSEAIAAFRFVGTKYNSEVGDLFVTFRKSMKTYRYEGVGLDKVMGIMSVVQDVIDEVPHKSVGYEVVTEIKGGGYECELVA
jgi:DNA gyrase inhibitor GyrI